MMIQPAAVAELNYAEVAHVPVRTALRFHRDVAQWSPCSCLVR